MVRITAFCRIKHCLIGYPWPVLKRKRFLIRLMLFLLNGSFAVYYFSSIRRVEKLDSIRFITDCCSSSPLANQSFSVVHSNLDPKSYKVDAEYVLVVPFSRPVVNADKSFVEELRDRKRYTLQMLGEFLHLRKDLDAVTCQQSTTRNRQEHYLNPGTDQTNNLVIKSTWCRFLQRNWSIQIRNTGQVSKHQFVFTSNTTTSGYLLKDRTVVYENCNIVEGPFLIRNHLFHRLGGLNVTFGKLVLFEFFVRSGGEVKVAKLKNCTWSHEITRADRGFLEGTPHFLEYATFGNKHNVLRIITENRIEWTTCVSNWKTCPEKPYARSRDITNIFRPICCRIVLGELLDDIVWAMNTLNIEYRIVYGTALGAVRSQAIIPWTNDVDIAINESAFDNTSTYTAIEKLFGNKYFAGEFWHMPRGFRHWPISVEVDTASMFDGPNDLRGDKFSSAEIEEEVNGMLPIAEHWRDHGYIDFYRASPEWMNGTSKVTIDGKTFVTIQDVDKELTNWYGDDYMTPEVKENWTGHH